MLSWDSVCEVPYHGTRKAKCFIGMCIVKCFLQHEQGEVVFLAHKNQNVPIVAWAKQGSLLCQDHCEVLSWERGQQIMGTFVARTKQHALVWQKCSKVLPWAQSQQVQWVRILNIRLHSSDFLSVNSLVSPFYSTRMKIFEICRWKSVIGRTIPLQLHSLHTISLQL